MKVNTFVVGSPKAGTTTLYSALSKTKDISLPIVKEPNYFTYQEMVKEKQLGISDAEIIDNIESRHIGIVSIEDIEKNYRDERSIVMDFSTSYTRYHEVVSKRLFEYNPNARIVLLIREPLERIQSHYAMDCRIGYTRKSLQNLLVDELKGSRKTSYFQESDYISILESYRKYFKNIKIIDFDKKIRAKEGNLKSELEGFLGVVIEEFELSKDNEGSEARLKTINYLLSKMGIKKILKKYINKNLKDRIRKFYFKSKTKNNTVDFSPEVIEKLKLLKSNYKELNLNADK